MSDNPYSTTGAPAPQGGDFEPLREHALARVKAPGIALLIVGILNLLLAAYGIGASVLILTGTLPAGDEQLAEQIEQIRQEMPQYAEMIDAWERFMTATQNPVLGLGSNLLSVVIAVLIIVGAIKMQRLQAYGLAMTASVLSMIPCLSDCCCLGVPVGIWSILVLSDTDVKRNFS